ncbi:tetratricopeptide repeat protein [Streptomyces sp. F001]|uniref:tetratricopeptide repeat protein n=1 Tax=Streptomyces sp. F001 TaxID=1510026 RepID=UPI0013EE87C5|nr:tetratricopeptide repeat protein [Streptomyces sp. F001]
MEILAVAPELRTIVPCSRETLTALAGPDERTRFYPKARTTQLAHGLTEFLFEYLSHPGVQSRTLVVANAHHADGTDAELLAILLRRADPGLLRLVVCGLEGELPGELATSLERHALRVVPDVAASPAELRPDKQSRYERAAWYVTTECTSDDPWLREAYASLPLAERAALHDARATELESRGEVSLRLGAIPFHRERGSDPRGAGVDALRDALDHCMMMGFYDTLLDLGRRSHALLDWKTQPERCWLVTTKMCTALTVLGRPDEAAALYDEACASSTLPSVHLQAAYGRAMLYTRFYDNGRLDHRQAKAWINTAIALSSLLPDRERRAFSLTFNENGLALIEMHLGDLHESLRLVTEGLRRLDEEVSPERKRLHRSVLRYNRAQLLTAIGPPEAAVQAYTEVIEIDPNHSEYYFERAAVYRRMGRLPEALADYDAATRLSPPYPEPYYNRADLAVEMGDLHAALADFGYTLELDPTFLDAYVNRASVRYELGDREGAMRDVAAGLAVDPDQPHLHCLRGLIAQEDGHLVEAREAFTTALHHDPTLVAAWSNLGVLSFGQGEVDAAIESFNGALELVDDPAVRGNRAYAYEHAGRWREAIEDYTRMLDRASPDREDPERGELFYRRGLCLLNSGDLRAALADFQECIALGGSSADEAQHELSSRGYDQLDRLRTASPTAG